MLRPYVIIVAAGSGSRMHAELPKQYLTLGSDGKTLLELTVDALRKALPDAKVVVAVKPADSYVRNLPLAKEVEILETGGKTREETVYQTLLTLQKEASPEALIFVHDAARALVLEEDIRRLRTLATAAIEKNEAAGAVLAIAVTDTVKRTDSNSLITEDISRTGLVRIATPQVFPLATLLRALEGNLDATDESSAVRAIGLKVKVLQGGPENFKVTTAADLTFAKKLKGIPMATRVGIGYDSHRLVAGRKLILGGVDIPFHLGLDGHSDADVLVHAVIDALLGAAHLGNIGKLFPDTDPAYKGADSIALLRNVNERLRAAGWQVINIDSVLVAEAPKINPHVKAIEENIARALGISAEAVSLKPKTNEGLGFEGKEKGMSAKAIVLIERGEKENAS